MKNNFRRPKHKQLLTEYESAKVDDSGLPFTIPEVIKEGAWADIPIEHKFLERKAKAKKLDKLRKQQRKAKKCRM